METFLVKIVPPILQVAATFIIFALGYKLNEKTRKKERTLLEADRKAEEEKKKANLKLMLFEELKSNYPILLELTRRDSTVSKLSFSVYRKYLDRLDALEPSEVSKILTAYSFMVDQVVNQYKEDVAQKLDSGPNYGEWHRNLCKNLEKVATTLELFDNGDQFVMESLVREVEATEGGGSYFLDIFKKLVKFGNRVVPDLIKMLESEHESIRSNASKTLEQIDTPEALKAVQAYEKREQDSTVRIIPD